MAELSFPFKSSNQNKELFNKGFGGSLALRVFSITVIFLVIPLLIYSLVMYRYDFIVKKSSEGEKLLLTAENEELIFSELLDTSLQRLQILSILIEEQKKTKTAPEISKILKEITQFTGVYGYFVIQKETPSKLELLYSSDDKIPKSSLDLIMNTKQLEDNNYGIITDFENFGQKGKIYFVKVLQREPDGAPNQIICLAVSNKFFMEYLTKTKGFEGSVSISLLDPKTNKIIDSQNLFLLGKKVALEEEIGQEDVILLKPVTGQEHIFEYEEQGVKGLATIVTLAEIDFQLLISSPFSRESTYVQKFFYQTIFFLSCVLIFGSLGSFGFTYLLSVPLKRLRDVMKKISQDDLSVRYEKSPYGFEINTLGLMLNTMIDQLIQNLTSLEKEKIKKEKLEQELFIGHQIQKSLIPRQLPDIVGMQIEAVLIPAKQVGGDFYDLFLHPSEPDQLIMIIADSAGHGIFGCFYSLMMRSILRSLGSTMKDFSQFITSSNAQFYKDSHETDVFVTAWIGSYNTKTKKLIYSSCGHPFGYVFRNQSLYKDLKTPGIALGALEVIEPVVEEADILPGDTLIFLTDGVLETKNGAGELYGKKRFVTVIENNLQLPIHQLLEKLIEDVENFEVSSDNQDDDFTAVIIRIS